MSQGPPTFTTNSILLKISPLFLEIMALRTVTSYGPQAVQVNEEPAFDSSLDLTLMQRPCDEDLSRWEVRARLEVDPFQAWYYHISPNFRTRMILLQIDLTSGNKLEIVCEGYYETEDTSIFC